MTMPSHLSAFWIGFAQACPDLAREDRFYEAFSFGDSPELADELAALVLQGRKRATAAGAWCYEAEAQRLPAPGDLSIVTNSAGEPLCVIETQSVEMKPFDEVDAAFAAAEGEGDGSLNFWQQAHRAFFSRECAEAGRSFNERQEIVCEQFRVAYAPARVAISAAQTPTLYLSRGMK